MSGRLQFSIIIPTYNHATFLQEALQSVVNQTFASWEAIVINNFSEDNTVEVVEGFQDPRIHLVNFRNNGIIGASRNRGIDLARGNWIAFLDSDDVWHPEKLSKCFATIDSDTDLIGHSLIFVRDGETMKIHRSGPTGNLVYNKLLLGGRSYLTPSSVIVRKECLDLAGGFSEDPAFVTAEDYDLWLKLARNRITFKIIDAPLTDYRFHADNASSSILRQMNATLAVVESHFVKDGGNSILTRMLRRRCRGIIYYGVGRGFQKNFQRDEAYKMFWESFKTFPF